jgi:DNA-binding response OmpR family regulator
LRRTEEKFFGDQQKLQMKPQVLLYTRDATFDGLLAEALSGTGATVLSTRTVSDALRIVCERGRELAFAVMDFDGGCRGMTLLSAVHTCYEQLPILVTTSEDGEHATALAYANGARGCLTKPGHAALLTAAISDLKETRRQLAAA